MTTYAQQIAERDRQIAAAAIEAAAEEATKCYIKSAVLFALGTEAAKAIRALDLDAIIASVPVPDALTQARELTDAEIVQYLRMHVAGWDDLSSEDCEEVFDAVCALLSASKGEK